jgi:hypothetical protein
MALYLSQSNSINRVKINNSHKQLELLKNAEAKLCKIFKVYKKWEVYERGRTERSDSAVYKYYNTAHFIQSK